MAGGARARWPRWGHPGGPARGQHHGSKGRAEPKRETIPASAIVVEAPQNALSGADSSAMPAGQELTAAAMVVEPDIEADNGVIHGIDFVLFSPEALRSF